MNNSDKIGSVMVVGGGIGGIQASLDLAESGFKVYLVENQTGIGGRMAQLDKTFPTNDCSTCIFSPKMLQAAQNPNIEILSYSEVEEVRGWEGHFKVVVRQKTRYVLPDRCKGCGDCAAACPVRLPNQFDQNMSDRAAIYRLFPQTVPQTFVIEKADRPPCVQACPAHVNVQAYVQLISQGKYYEALELIYEKVPLPGVLGRVCPHPCENACRRGEKDQPVSVCALKRFVADQSDYSILRHPKITPREEKVAVVGSGPAGLSAAYYLALEGFQVTIFEAAAVLGGWLRLGIPEYRLPRTVLEKDIQHILSLGISLRTNATLGVDFTLEDLKVQGFKATFLAVGCQKGEPLPIPGAYTEGVIQGVNLLRDVALGVHTGGIERAAVIGGGNVAMDASRTLLRLGAGRVTVLYRRSLQEMPASQEEIEAALAEGVTIQYQAIPLVIRSARGRVSGITWGKAELGEPDESGRRKPILIEGSESVLEADTIVLAIGQMIDPDLWRRLPGIGRTDRDTIHVNKTTGSTIVDGVFAHDVFAAGDAATEPATVVEAIAGGREAAQSISRYLKGEDMTAGRQQEFPVNPKYRPIPDGRPRTRTRGPALPVAERKNFQEVELGLAENDALQEASRCISCGFCSECMECVKACPADAIDHTMEAKKVCVDVGSIILSTGYEMIDPSKIRGEFAYGMAANVLTNMEFERMLSASGPNQGEITRPSDGKHPKKIAWIQCVGSRDPQKGLAHCSSVCCMASMKEAVIAKEHDPNIQPTIFYLDLRAYGKDFYTYFQRAKNEGGVRFVRSLVSRVVANPRSQDLELTYLDEAQRLQTETFDMVVLAVGLRVSQGSRQLAEKLGVHLNESGFCATTSFAPVQTSRPGVLVAGMLQAPKDIPQTVIEASAAAGISCRILASARNTMTTAPELPPEKDVSDQRPRIGVFVCRCGINIAATVDVSEVVRRVEKLPDVIYAGENLFTCSQDTQVQIKKTIEEHDLNRIVVASCTPRTHLTLFQETARGAGLNRYLVEMANIREHCSWVHMKEKDRATEKAVDLIRMAVARARRLEPVWNQQLPLVQSALVIGGGVAGMTAALDIAAQGFAVDLLEATGRLGGNALRLSRTVKGEEVQPFLNELIQKVNEHESIHVHYDARITEIQGFVGNFKTVITENGSEPLEIEHGVAVVATGAKEWKPDVFGYGSDPRIRTQLEMSEAMAARDPSVVWADCTVFIQCVGSRCEERPWCSKVCCNHTIMEALALKEKNPRASVYVLYRDMTTYGLNEPLYEKCRRSGVRFIRYEPEDQPVVQVGEKVMVTAKDPVVCETVAMAADNLVLAAAIVPNDSNKELAKFFKIPLHQHNYYLEAHMKLRPVDFATDGVFLAGLAHYPKPLDETIAQAEAAGCHAAQVLARGSVEVAGSVSVVDQYLCRGCGLCVDTCPFHSPQLKQVAPGVFKSEVNPALCKGCGICGVVCPTGAAQVRHFKDEQIGDMIEAALQ
ncbi:MAG: FAD-dependent oxidoreductase [Desulfomonile tiedjei]|uniref:FAD-dependent oxidoreductase n=1 Tax=Desulfomonile tiedjei TaxID=2358 RepID=A0A9D6V531_9BACT|nr:FAD-dependent oxidoreductase [Desulfomonile tiedjei]